MLAWTRRRGRRRPGHRPLAVAQAAEEADAAASGHDHRQAGELSGGEGGADARGRAPPAQGPEQQGRELASADPAAPTPDEALQINLPSTTIPLRPRPG